MSKYLITKTLLSRSSLVFQPSTAVTSRWSLLNSMKVAASSNQLGRYNSTKAVGNTDKVEPSKSAENAAKPEASKATDNADKIENPKAGDTSDKTEASKVPEEVYKYVPVNRWEGSWHWYGERGLSVALVPMLCVSGFYGGHPLNDFLLGFLVPVHTHIGLSAIVTDYIPYRRLPIINRVVTVTQFLLTTATMYGCYIINTEDIGLSEYVKLLWCS